MKSEKINLLLDFKEQGEFLTQEALWEEGGYDILFKGMYTYKGFIDEGELHVFLEKPIYKPEEVLSLPWENYQLWWTFRERAILAEDISWEMLSCKGISLSYSFITVEEVRARIGKKPYVSLIKDEKTAQAMAEQLGIIIKDDDIPLSLGEGDMVFIYKAPNWIMVRAKEVN